MRAAHVRQERVLSHTPASHPVAALEGRRSAEDAPRAAENDVAGHRGVACREREHQRRGMCYTPGV